MKKSFIYRVLLSIVAFTLFAFEVHANTYRDGTVNKVTNGEAVLVCAYGNPGLPSSAVELYYIFQSATNANQIGGWHMYYKKKNSWELHRQGTFQYVFSGNSQVHWDFDGTRFQNSFEDNFYCPKNNFLDFDWYDELCFSDKEYCGDEFEGGPYGQINDGTSVFEIIKKYADETVYDTLNLSQIMSSSSLLDTIKDKTRSFVVSKYYFGTKSIMPLYIDNYLKNLENHITLQNTTAYNEFREEILEEIDEKVEAGDMSEEEAEELKEKLSENLYEALGSPSISGGLNVSDEDTCTGLLGDAMTKIVKNIFKLIQYAAPVLVAVLTIVDFLKASLSGDPADVKKASDKLMKRLVAAILLFFIPIICGILLDVGGITVPDNCIR